MRIETERLMITEFLLEMAEDVHKNSLDEDNRRFVLDEITALNMDFAVIGAAECRMLLKHMSRNTYPNLTKKHRFG